MSIRKVLTIISTCSAAVLVYYAIRKGLDVAIAIALVLSVASMGLNIYCEVHDGRKED
jgi:hypothetical protein